MRRWIHIAKGALGRLLLTELAQENRVLRQQNAVLLADAEIARQQRTEALRRAADATEARDASAEWMVKYRTLRDQALEEAGRLGRVLEETRAEVARLKAAEVELRDLQGRSIQRMRSEHAQALNEARSQGYEEGSDNQADVCVNRLSAALKLSQRPDPDTRRAWGLLEQQVRRLRQGEE